MSKLEYGSPFSVTATHATAAVASNAGVNGKKHFISHVSVSSDKAGSIMLIKQGTTVLWQVQVGASKHEETFSPELEGVSGGLVSVEIDGTSACKANISGVTI